MGNIKPGEDAAVELEYFRLLGSCGGKVRFTIPTVIGERYASDPSEIPTNQHAINHNLFADYDFEGVVLIKGRLADAKVSSPTHQLKFSRVPEGLRVEIVGGKLDRDMVLDLEGPMVSGLYLAKDGDNWAALANFIIPSQQSSLPLDLNILADCSGSMSGYRIDCVRKALFRMGRNLRQADQISLACFGSGTELRLLPNRMGFANFQRNFMDVVDEIEADLGGTNLAPAVSSCMNLFPGKSPQSAMLLLTDGEIWGDIESIVESAKEAGRRIFVLGIGLAPYHNQLLDIAERTGGAYETVYNEYDIDSAVQRMITRIRAAVLTDIEVKWDAPQIWTSPNPKAVFACDNCAVFAFLEDAPKTVRLQWKCGEESHSQAVEVLSEKIGYKLCQLAASRRIVDSQSKELARELGVKYNIAGPETNFFLSVEREENEKTDGSPVLEIVPQMVPADSGIADVVDCFFTHMPRTRLCSRSPRKASRKASRSVRQSDSNIEKRSSEVLETLEFQQEPPASIDVLSDGDERSKSSNAVQTTPSECAVKEAEFYGTIAEEILKRLYEQNVDAIKELMTRFYEKFDINIHSQKRLPKLEEIREFIKEALSQDRLLSTLLRLGASDEGMSAEEFSELLILCFLWPTEIPTEMKKEFLTALKAFENYFPEFKGKASIVDL